MVQLFDPTKAAEELLKRIARDGVEEWPVSADEGSEMPSLEVAEVAVRVWNECVVKNIRLDLMDFIYNGGDPTSYDARDLMENAFALFRATTDDKFKLNGEDTAAISAWIEMKFAADTEVWRYILIHSDWLSGFGRLYALPDGRRFELRRRGDFIKMWHDLSPVLAKT